MIELDFIIFIFIIASMLFGFLFLVKTVIEMPEFFIIIQIKKEEK
ncbi:hypothetical protein LCGC14_1215080 [marine sediment metagenome]|uniref:Uncharacterized protein n=1 Tax=marine sediment metagenome TaxID=412755 RepID=A0A0F9PHL3_9ZZZZ